MSMALRKLSQRLVLTGGLLELQGGFHEFWRRCGVESGHDIQDMIGALEARDGQRLSTAMLDHLAQAWGRIKNAI